MEFASSRHHRSSVFPSGIRTVQIDDLCSRRWIGVAIERVKIAWASAHNQYLAIIVHNCGSPITGPVVAIPHRVPSTGISNIKISGRLAGPCAEHLSVRRNKHVWIEERQCQVRCAQVAPGCGCSLPYLRLDIDVSRCDRAADHEHVSVRQASCRRIPSTIIHIRQARPGIVQRVIFVSVG